MEKHVLSKSTFIRGHQCLKSLYLYKRRYFLRDPLPDEQRIKFKRGHDVGTIAQGLFPGGKDMGTMAPSRYQKSVAQTRHEIDKGTRVLYEAGFQFERVLVFLDVLYLDNGRWNACEIKSSRAISETYLLDAALQYYVITNSGLALSSFYIAHINEDYVLENELDLRSLFKIVDVTADVQGLQDYVREQIAREMAILELQHSPKIDIGPHCHNPYPCDFIGHCWKNIDKEVVSIENISSEKIKDVSLVGDNVSFLHISTFSPAIPIYRGTRPYQEIPFQFSLIGSNDELQSYLLPPGHHPGKLIARLSESLRGIGAVVTDAGYQMPVPSEVGEPGAGWTAQLIRLQEFFAENLLKDVADKLLKDDPFNNLKLRKGVLVAEAYHNMLMDKSLQMENEIIEYGNKSVYLIQKIYRSLINS